MTADDDTAREYRLSQDFGDAAVAPEETAGSPAIDPETRRRMTENLGRSLDQAVAELAAKHGTTKEALIAGAKDVLENPQNYKFE